MAHVLSVKDGRTVAVFGIRDILDIVGDCAGNDIQHYLEENGFEITSAEFERIPNDMKQLDAEQRASIEKLIERFEEDEDVQNVFHNMQEENEDE